MHVAQAPCIKVSPSADQRFEEGKEKALLLLRCLQGSGDLRKRVGVFQNLNLNISEYFSCVQGSGQCRGA